MGVTSASGRTGLWNMPSRTTINSQVFLGMLKDKLRMWLEIKNCNTFQHDGAPCHQARLVKNWIQQEDINILGQWPGSSPDLNLIENYWVLRKRKVTRYNPTSVQQLREVVTRVWTQEITENYRSLLVHSMPSRIQAVLAANGRHTKY